MLTYVCVLFSHDEILRLHCSRQAPDTLVEQPHVLLPYIMLLPAGLMIQLFGEATVPVLHLYQLVRRGRSADYSDLKHLVCVLCPRLLTGLTYVFICF